MNQFRFQGAKGRGAAFDTKQSYQLIQGEKAGHPERMKDARKATFATTGAIAPE